MCGIAGLVSDEADLESIRSMTRTLDHRGPDDRGVWIAAPAALGHTRLAIIDLSAAGHQPMEFGDYVIVYNGEIYNYRELRDELPGPFRSNSDTEVLLHLYARDGERCVEKLHGMFAFAIWDRRRRRLFAARDRLGIKPLLYRRIGDGIAFASELKALLPLGRPDIERSAIRDFLTYGYIPSPKTIYQSIAKLPPAHTLVWEAGRISTRRYWQVGADIRYTDAEQARERLDELLATIIPQHTLADVPVGVFLSGGIDSAATAYYLGRPRTFTLGFDERGRSEADAARAVAVHLRTEHQEMTARVVDVDEALEQIPRIYDEPFGDSAAWSNLLISELARRNVTVALSGEGGDELFCGYARYWRGLGTRSSIATSLLARVLPPLSRAGHSMQGRSAQGLAAYVPAMGGLMPRQVELLLHPDYYERDYDDLWFYRQYWREGLDPAQAMRWLDLHTALPEGLLTKVDRASMAHSLEVRPPLLDHRLVEFALSVHPDLLIDRPRGQGKVLLRRLMEPRLPRGHAGRPKLGFGLPLRRWMAKHPDVLLALQRLRDAGILRRSVGSSFRKIWFLLVLDRWVSQAQGARDAVRQPAGSAFAMTRADS